MSHDHYSTLGVPRDASADQIKRAYRRRISKAHSDRGGSQEDAARVNVAYETLSNAQRRLTYDRTGEDRIADVDRLARQLIVGMVCRLMDAEEITGNLIESVKMALLSERAMKSAAQRAGLKKVATIERRMKRIHFRGGRKSEDFLTSALESQLDKLKQQVASAKDEFEVADLAMRMIEDYEYDEEAAARAGGGWNLFFTAGG